MNTYPVNQRHFAGLLCSGFRLLNLGYFSANCYAMIISKVHFHKETWLIVRRDIKPWNFGFTPSHANLDEVSLPSFGLTVQYVLTTYVLPQRHISKVFTRTSGLKVSVRVYGLRLKCIRMFIFKAEFFKISLVTNIYA